MPCTHFKLTNISLAVQSVLKLYSCTLSITSLKKIDYSDFILNTDQLHFKAFDLKVAQIFSLNTYISLSLLHHFRYWTFEFFLQQHDLYFMVPKCTYCSSSVSDLDRVMLNISCSYVL